MQWRPPRAAPADLPASRPGPKYPRCRGGGAAPTAARSRNARRARCAPLRPTETPRSGTAPDAAPASARPAPPARSFSPPPRCAAATPRVVAGCPPCFAFSLLNIAQSALLYSKGDPERGNPRCGTRYAAAAGHQIAAQGNAAGGAQADRAIRGGGTGFQRHPADSFRHRPEQGVHRKSLRSRPRAFPHAQRRAQARTAPRAGFRGPQGQFFYTRQRLQKGLGDAVLCGERFAGEEPFLVALGDSILGLHAVSRAVSRMADVSNPSAPVA